MHRGCFIGIQAAHDRISTAENWTAGVMDTYEEKLGDVRQQREAEATSIHGKISKVLGDRGLRWRVGRIGYPTTLQKKMHHQNRKDIASVCHRRNNFCANLACDFLHLDFHIGVRAFLDSLKACRRAALLWP